MLSATYGIPNIVVTDLQLPLHYVCCAEFLGIYLARLQRWCMCVAAFVNGHHLKFITYLIAGNCWIFFMHGVCTCTAALLYFLLPSVTRVSADGVGAAAGSKAARPQSPWQL